MASTRGLRFRWVFRDGRGGFSDAPIPIEDPSRNGQAARSGARKYPGLVYRLLTARAMLNADAFSDARSLDQRVDHLLHTTLHDLHDASLLPGIDEAADRLIRAVRHGERIVIYGDYDVDGITATAILYHAIKTAQPDADVRTYVPHRLNEGYGLNTDAFDQLQADGADLVISVDCGISALEAAAHARAIGLDLIITDHHNLPPEEAGLPDATILVHPRLPGSNYPWGDLCGAGVAFKIAWRFATAWCGSERVSESFRNLLTQLLAFVALGTIADVVPLRDENRTLARFGLKMMRHTEFVGLNALISAAGLADEKRIDSEAVGFRLGPRLNACGRMGHAREAVDLFTTAPSDRAHEIAKYLNKQNIERQAAERAIFAQACELAESAGMTKSDRRIIVLAHHDWHPGVVGIVCSRLVERFGRPAILMQRSTEIVKGSGRSIDGYSIHAGLSATAKHLTTWGGHDMAAGLSLLPDQFEPFVDALTEHANAHIAEADLVPRLKIDGEAALSEITEPVVHALMDLGPFGRSNPHPAFLVRGLRIQAPPQEMGSAGKHLALRVIDPNRPARMIRLVGWGMGDLAPQLAAGLTIDVVIRPKIGRWMGREQLEAEVKDVRVVK